MDPLLYAREHDLDRQLARTQTMCKDATDKRDKPSRSETIRRLVELGLEGEVTSNGRQFCDGPNLPLCTPLQPASPVLALIYGEVGATVRADIAMAVMLLARS
jgi:hypothetical protein